MNGPGCLWARNQSQLDMRCGISQSVRLNKFSCMIVETESVLFVIYELNEVTIGFWT